MTHIMSYIFKHYINNVKTNKYMNEKESKIHNGYLIIEGCVNYKKFKAEKDDSEQYRNKAAVPLCSSDTV